MSFPSLGRYSYVVSVLGGWTATNGRVPVRWRDGSNSRHAHVCPQAGAHVGEYQLIINAISWALKQLWIGHSVEDGSLFLVERNLRVDVVVRACELRHESKQDYRHIALLVNVIFTDPQAIT